MILTALACAALAPSIVSGVLTEHGKPVRDAAVWLETSVKSKPGKAEVDQRHSMFDPHVQVVTVGSQVNFPNDDDIFHNVYAEFQAKRFDLGVYPKGQTKTVKFDKPGVVSVLCNVHSSMSAYIVVVDTPFFAKTDDNGRFKIKGVPDQKMTLHVWHESGKTFLKAFASPAQASDLKLTLTR